MLETCSLNISKHFVTLVTTSEPILSQAKLILISLAMNYKTKTIYSRHEDRALTYSQAQLISITKCTIYVQINLQNKTTTFVSISLELAQPVAIFADFKASFPAVSVQLEDSSQHFQLKLVGLEPVSKVHINFNAIIKTV